MGESFRVKWFLVFIEFILQIILGNLGVYINLYKDFKSLFIYYGVYFGYLVLIFFGRVMKCNDSLSIRFYIIVYYALVSNSYSVSVLDLLPILWQFRHLMFR